MKLDDGRRLMPKLHCPCCSKRFGDVPNTKIKNMCLLSKYDSLNTSGIILECPHCHNKVCLSIKDITGISKVV